MKKSIHINLGGSIFFIDEDAYIKLEQYLKRIKEYLGNSQEKGEIIQDIEMRIAELLIEKRSSKQEAVVMSHIEEIIEIMGQPEDYKLEEEEEASKFTDSKPTKRLYRDTEDKFISGIASGLSHYIGMDPVWMRLIWVLIVLAGVGSPIIIYILLWILVPEARTTTEKLQMKGKNVNFSNIEQSFKEQYANVAKKVKDTDIKGMTNTFKEKSASFFDWLLKVGRNLVRAVVFTFGLILLISSFVTIISLVVLLFIPENNLYYSGVRLGTNIYSLNNTSVTSIHFWILKIASNLSLIIPFIFLFILSLLAINPKRKPIGRYTKTGLLIVWTMAVATTVYYIVSAKSATKFTGRTLERVDLKLSKTDTLMLHTKLHASLANVDTSSDYLIQNDSMGGQYIYGTRFNILIKPTDDLYASMVIEKSTKSSAIDKANTQAESIDYNYSLEGNNLTLNDYFFLHNTMLNNNARIKIYINLPKDMLIKLDNHSVRNSTKQNRKDKIAAGEFLRINDKVIECISCEEENIPDTKAVIIKDPIEQETDKANEDWEKKVEEAFKSF